MLKQCNRHPPSIEQLGNLYFQDPTKHLTLFANNQLRFGNTVRPASAGCSSALVPQPAEEKVPDSWTSEPQTLNALLDTYYVESKLPGREPGTALLIAHAKNRQGETTEIVANQKYKLFLVA